MATRTLVQWPNLKVSHIVWDSELNGWLIEGSGPFSLEEVTQEMGGRLMGLSTLDNGG